MIVTDKSVKTFNKKQACQTVPDKSVLLSIKNNLVKKHLASLFYLLSRITLSSSTRQACLTVKNNLVKQYLTILFYLLSKTILSSST